MDKTHSIRLGSLILAFVVVSAGCFPSTPPPTPSALPPTLTATATAPPTSTPIPTATPNLAATQERASRLAELESYLESGYITTTSGFFREIPDFHKDWAKIDYYRWWPQTSLLPTYDELVFRGHFSWSMASPVSETSGCGVVFGRSSDDLDYAVFVDRSRILVLRSGREVGKTRGSGRLNIAAPYEAEVAVIVNGQTSHVIVNGEATQYSLMDPQPAAGGFAVSVLSGTNKDYGTRCSITNAYLWLKQ